MLFAKKPIYSSGLLLLEINSKQIFWHSKILLKHYGIFHMFYNEVKYSPSYFLCNKLAYNTFVFRDVIFSS
jgi:hypothetical protein